MLVSSFLVQEQTFALRAGADILWIRRAALPGCDRSSQQQSLQHDLAAGPFEVLTWLFLPAVVGFGKKKGPNSQ